MRQTNVPGRRKFLKAAAAAAAGCMSAASLSFGFSSRSEKSDAFRLVGETDRRRILESAAKYVSQTPLTITAFPARRSEGDCTISIPKRTTSGQIRKIQMGRTSTSTDRAIRRILTSTARWGMQRQVLAYNQNLMLVRHHFLKGWKGTSHSHPHEQLVYVMAGRIQFSRDGKTIELRSGDSIVVESNVEHQATALEDSEVLDVFAPYREDYAQ